MREKPIIAITMGDPAGIGPEVTVKALASSRVWEICRPVIIGSMPVFTGTAGRLSFNRQFTPVQTADELDLSGASIPLLDCCSDIEAIFETGRESAVAGEAAARAMKKAVELALAKHVDAVVTGPISKHALHLAGYTYPGQTEFLAELTGAPDVVMMLVSRRLRVALVTTHCSISRVAESITPENILSKLIILDKALKEYFGIQAPKIAVCALNPHAGEGGLFGREEIESITPAIEQARSNGINATGPFPADSLFARSQEVPYDAYLAMYHDQGLIPLKMNAAGRGVNVTLGLPLIRTSPDHGTAFDIAGRGIADPASMIAAITLAARMAGKMSNH